jgi:hypothetical protein
MSWSGVPEDIRERHILGDAIETWQRHYGCGERAFEEALDQQLGDPWDFHRLNLAAGFDRDRLLPEFTD